ncbi:hypothetical protein [Catellatospora methionotrophica]|uniref:hypothetical protein n=1 Tax=Catellatospora methionotrophica TaxID=121620 RepID=UPI00140BD258|nr:hypothetical protein [Catellatospora methionotrophica]
MTLPEWVKAAVIAAAASAAAVLCTPWAAALVPDAPGSSDYHVPLTWQDAAQPVALAIIALAGGRWGLSVLVTGLAVTMPAAVVYSVYGEYFVDAAGAGLWPVGIVVLAPLVFGAAVGLAALGRMRRRRLGARRRAARAAA